MAVILPFHALRYNPDRIPDPGAVIAPPYDVISAEIKQRLTDRDPHNVIRLILPEGDPATKYQNAAALLAEWTASGTLIRDPEPAMYIYSQRFIHPENGLPVDRKGLLATVGLEPFNAGVILPHERTLSGPKADRLELMRATGGNLEPIFSLYRDAGALEMVSGQVQTDPPVISATDSDGLGHCLWRVADPVQIGLLQRDLAGSLVFIVDGHHRYETALAYQQERRAASPGLAPKQPFDSILMFLAPANDPGLIILPTHRVIHSLADFSPGNVQARLREHFSLMPCDSSVQLQTLMREQAGSTCFGLLFGERAVLAVLRDGLSRDALVDPAQPPALRELDVTILHEHILEHILGIGKQAQASQANLRYVKSFAEAVAEAGRPDVQMVALMNPTRLDQVQRVAESGSVMPQKSTFFYPKLASGLIFNIF